MEFIETGSLAEPGRPPVARAPRYRLETDLLYRRRGDHRWCSGRIENMSRSGVLFRAPDMLQQGDAVALRFEIPVEIYGQPPALVACHGAIVRSEPGQDSELPCLAATILRFRIVRRRAAAGA